jgi:hypothetical protein
VTEALDRSLPFDLFAVEAVESERLIFGVRVAMAPSGTCDCGGSAILEGLPAYLLGCPVGAACLRDAARRFGSDLRLTTVVDSCQLG